MGVLIEGIRVFGSLDSTYYLDVALLTVVVILIIFIGPVILRLFSK